MYYPLLSEMGIEKQENKISGVSIDSKSIELFYWKIIPPTTINHYIVIVVSSEEIIFSNLQCED